MGLAELGVLEAGWLIVERAAAHGGARGGARGGDRPTQVIERESGRVITFPTAIPAARILADYDAVRAEGTAAE